VRIIDGAGAFTRGPESTHWVEQLRVPDLSVGTYSIPAGGVDDQQPHAEDEIYVVTTGRAMFEVHRFTDITQDLAAIVIFGPAEGSRQ
jgi:hypothetical protein